MKRVAIVSAAVLGSAFGAVLLVAGPLNPPAGAVSSTYKTLTEVEPRIAINATNTPGDADSVFKITQPGSYYLTGNMAGVSGKSGIEVAANSVTIDLNGFALVGVAGSLDGIGSSSSIARVAIENGTISGWGDEGIDMGTASTVLGARVERVHVSSCGGDGIYLESRAVVRDCVVQSVSGNGISIENAGVVESCIVSGSTLSGIVLQLAGVIKNCVAYRNTIDGINLAAAGVVSGCDSHDNGGDGIESAGAGYVTILDCTAHENAGDGIRVGAGAIVENNQCAFNVAAGIHTTGSDCRIERNNCMVNARGIDVDTIGSVIIRNTCSGNSTNWDVASGNVILVVNATTAGAVSGNAGGTAPGSTDPNANFSY